MRKRLVLALGVGLLALACAAPVSAQMWDAKLYSPHSVAAYDTSLTVTPSTLDTLALGGVAAQWTIWSTSASATVTYVGCIPATVLSNPKLGPVPGYGYFIVGAGKIAADSTGGSRYWAQAFPCTKWDTLLGGEVHSWEDPITHILVDGGGNGTVYVHALVRRR